MKKVIWKFPLQEVENVLEMPSGAEILTVQVQNGIPCLWALVDPSQEKIKKRFNIYGTGHEMDNTDKIYINTFQAGPLVFHVFEDIAYRTRMSLFYILKDNEIATTTDVLEWGKFMEGKERLIKQENVEKDGKKYFVSTVFLGIDQGFSFLTEKRPILFETMIFPEKESENWEEYQTRCCTLEESLKQHQEAINFLNPH